MDEQQRTSVVGSSSNSSSLVVSSKNYDVFLSFRGEDTRRGFTSHLYKALNERKVKTYQDNQIEKGDEISEALTKAIEDSHVSIVIFSDNYASSKWCLNELNKIMECKRNQGQIVIPVFYNIDPSHVRKQTGSYKEAFSKHEGDPKYNKWKDALTATANLAGLNTDTYRNDSELLEDIVEEILQKLPPRYPNQRGLVGIDKHYKKIESLLEIGSSEVRTVGIWGMGGIGKTTLAIALYNNLSNKFEDRCLFRANVREKSNKLQDRDKSELIWLRGKKVFIVLDDVDTSERLEELLVDYDFWKPGSRIIVTTRNRQIFRQDDEIYSMAKLTTSQSLQLFCLTTFGDKQPKDGYEDLSRRVIEYCQGIPLALKVLGASLRPRRSKEAWESELEKLQKIPKMEIHKVLKLIYDDLDCSLKDMFLDIACFFNGWDENWVTSLLEACDFFPASEIEVLSDKTLITISPGNKIQMHALIQEMGRKIVDQECIRDPGRRSRLWRHEEVHHVLKHNKGTEVVQGIILDLHKLTEDLYLDSDSLGNMTNLRGLGIHGYRNEFNVYFPKGLESLPDKLRCLYWAECCLESLPTNFCIEQLRMLSMPSSKLKKLWDGDQNPVNLKKINLEDSQDLIETPNLSMAEKLESVYLGKCESLRQLHPSLLSHPKLKDLDLTDCRKIKSLNVHLKSLHILRLHGCSSLKEISVMSNVLKNMDLSGCKVIESLNVHSESLCTIDLSGCSSLKEILLTSCELKSLDLSRCSSIESINVHSKSLCILRLHDCSSLKKISVISNVLKNMDLSGCKVIESLNVHSESLCTIDLSGCSSLKEILVT